MFDRSEHTLKTKTQCDKYIRSGLLVYSVIFIGGPNRHGDGTTWAETTWGQVDVTLFWKIETSCPGSVKSNYFTTARCHNLIVNVDYIMKAINIEK
jgi:hypothetical protein